MNSLADLKKGEKGTIASFTDDLLSLKLLEMGCLPNTEVVMCGKAPFGDPIYIEIEGYHLTLRLAEASTVLLNN